MAFYSEEVIEEVKAANDIVDVISSYVTIRRRGSTFFGPCPFHKEKTPSFAVTPDRQIYHCFGCGEGGNVLNFIMKIENIGFKEALELLADRAKITLPNINNNNNFDKNELQIIEQKKKQMYLINSEAGRFFFDNIEKSAKAKEFIMKRQLDIKTIRKFGLGFALDDNGLFKHLLSKGFKEEDILATGLIGKSDRGVFYDKFKERFMFPIFDVRNRVVAFGGRTLESSEVMKAQHIPKYVNSPENLIYTKGRHLYGLNVVKQTSNQKRRILVVEGYMDVISPYQRGAYNIVASLGTALTENQGRLLRQYADEIVLSYDSDLAGQNAIVRGLEILQSLGMTAKVLQMTGAKDPDEYVLKYGAEKFESVIENSISLVEFKIDNLKSQYDLSNTTDKIKFLNKMAEILSKVDNNIEREIYVERISSSTGVGKEAILAEIEKYTIKGSNNLRNWQEPIPITQPKITKVDEKQKGLEKVLVYLLCEKDVKIYKILAEEVSGQDINDEIYKKFVFKLYAMYENGDINNADVLNICDNEEETSILTELMMSDYNFIDIYKLSEEVANTFKVNKLQMLKQKLIKDIEQSNDESQRELMLKQLNDVILSLAKK